MPVWFLLDEFGNIPRIPGMDTKLTVAAGRGIRFLLALQDLAQLKKYGDASQTMTGNCDTWLFPRTDDVETAKVISAKLGTFTVRASSHSMQSVSGRHTQSEGATARPPGTSDEALRWPSGHSLLMQSGEHPADMPLQDPGGWRSASAAFQPADPPKSREAEAEPTWFPGGRGSRGDKDASFDPVAPAGDAQSAAASTIPAEVAGSVEQGPETLAQNTPNPERPAAAARPKGSGRLSGGRGRA